ncbi:hypothetical protein LTR97_002003 [Elasticomyces elasticus]|uniref:Peptidase M6-like domain-containing protein n=1 Tax=Elasticomyces elasticus TaxID=574655 RepID=A0AAN8A4J1_9PEZI|nr:hypothetical protein LTR97_002003 [Elasticomyces elasticus]
MTADVSPRFRKLFFSTGRAIPTGSVTEYYEDVSGGHISLTGEVIGPYRMPHNSSHYANGQKGLGSEFPNIRTLAADAFTAVKASRDIDLKPYDNDKNGYVDAFIVVHAGRGSEETGSVNDIWSAKWVLPDEVTVNTVKVFGFLTIPEDANIGVCAHELGHLLFGWPDLYDIDSPETGITGVISAGIGDWCLMSGGSWGHLPGNKPGTTPCHPSAWCKATQRWVNVVAETDSHSIALRDVKLVPRKVHRLWTNGDLTSKEYFLIENREKAGFDESLPGAGLLADGLNELATARGGRGDEGDPFPGKANNRSFNLGSNPNSRSYSGRDSYVAIRDISPAAQNMSMFVSVRSFTPVYAQGEPGNGIGGYDLRSREDRSIAFDYDSSGKMDHLILYRPGTGTCWILANSNGAFHAKYARGDPGNGIGGYDLRSTADRAIAFDYDSSGNLDHLIFYRPGRGAIFIIKRSGAGEFASVYAQGDGGSGIGGFYLRSAADRLFAFDYNQSGKQDHLCLYRPGTGTMWILRNMGGSFHAVYAQGDPGSGIGGFDLKSPADRAFAFD